MKANSLAIIAGFIQTFPQAWEVFAKSYGDVKIDSFTFEQDHGSYVLTDDKGATYRFRLYREDIIAVTMPSFCYVLVGCEYILL
jgi:hypothetical protein